MVRTRGATSCNNDGNAASSSAGHKRAREPEIHDDCSCAVCFDVLLDPVTLACGHTLDQRCLQRLVAAGGSACPTCREPLPAVLPAVNVQFRNVVQRQYPQQVEARRVEVLKEVQRARDMAELLEWAVEAVSTADKDTLCVIAVHAAAQAGVDMNTRAEAAAGEEPKERWLSVAAKEGLGETVRALLETGAEVDHVNNLGRTALWGAALHGRVEALQALLAAGAEVDHEDNRGQSALGHAASNGKVEAVQALLAAGAEVNHASNLGHTALSGAAGNGHVGAIQVLLEAGAEVDHVNINGCTALCVAASNGEVDAVRALLAAGAGVNRASNNGYTALWGAALCGKVEAIRALLLAGADFNHASQGDSPLAIARIMHREEAALALVEAGATE